MFISCSSLKPENCNYDFGHTEGYEDGSRDHYFYPPKNEDNICSEKSFAELDRGYREGFKKGKSSKSKNNSSDTFVENFSQKKECLTAFGKKACGFHCTSGYGLVKCASKPDQQCVSAFGKIKCGYNCVAKLGDIVCH